MGALRLEEGQVRFIGATSNLMLLPSSQGAEDEADLGDVSTTVLARQESILSWTRVTQDKDLILHLIVCHTCGHRGKFLTLADNVFHIPLPIFYDAVQGSVLQGFFPRETSHISKTHSLLHSIAGTLHPNP